MNPSDATRATSRFKSDMKLVIFDMDGVLCHLSDEDRIQFLADLTGRNEDDLADAIWNSGFEAESDNGKYSATEYLTEFGNRIGFPITREQWIDYRHSGMSPKRDVLDIAIRVSATHQLAILTNNGWMLKESIAHLFPELSSIFDDKIFVSAEFNRSKPDSEIFRAICERMGFAVESTIFIDDRNENVLGAREAGLTGILFIDAENLEKELSLVL